MTGIRRAKLLTHPVHANLGEPATFIAFYLLAGDQPLIQPIRC
jgi:hypothetical protein